MVTRVFRVAAALLVAAAGQAQGAFHLITSNELYSNADGTVQYVELTALEAGQQYLFGHFIGAFNSAGVNHNYDFPNDLPGGTAGTRFLVATQGFAALGIVTPDYIVPNGFFFQGGGAVNFAGVDVWNHGPLPTDGRSLNRD